jgi:hypothetical protein
MKSSQLILLALLFLPLGALAARYRVDVIVFLDNGGYSTEKPRPFRPVDVSQALEPDAAALTGTPIQLIPDSAFGMEDLWRKLRTSRRYQPMVKLAWLQTDPPADRNLLLHVHAGAPLNLTLAPASAPGGNAQPSAQPPQTLDGTIGLRLSHYLYLDADLSFTQPLPDGTYASYRLKEVRRMKRDDLHQLDSPHIGVLARVTKAVETPAPASAPPPGNPPK